MKKLLFILFLAHSFSFGNDITTDSEIKKVTVYLQGAQVTRQVNVQLLPGTHELFLNDLSPFIDENSIQITGLKSASVLAVNYKIDYLKKENSKAQIELLLTQERQLNKQLSLLKNKIDGLKEEETVLITNRKLGVDQAGNDLAKVKEFAIYYGQRIASIKNDIYDSNQKIEDINKEIILLKKQIDELEDNNGPERGEIKLKLNTALTVNLALEVSYTVSNAGWFPVYDIKAKNINNPLSFYYKAHVYQQTGTDWNNAKITLSTGDPSLDTNKPDVTPYYLNFVTPYTYKNKASLKKSRFKYNPLVKKVSGVVLDESGLPLPGVNVVIKGTTLGTQTDFDGKYALDITEGQELVFSYIGQKTHEVPVYASLMNVKLEADAQALEEVVVTGYGNSVAGSTSGVRIRGVSSIKADTPVLYIVDGVRSTR
ncbi:mucoidy inhibitor MuiA family protein [Flavobacteriaceae bacterium R38]|nr:mucoidy inhibitor MuiA family protein [Flavobacteriaceae bacterium R38]